MELALDQLAERFDILCRFCLSDADCVPIFLADNNFNERLQKGFEVIASKVDENDGLPNNICSRCMRCIEEFVSFEAKCIKSYELLEQVLQMSETATDDCFPLHESNTKEEAGVPPVERAEATTQAEDVSHERAAINVSDGTLNERGSHSPDAPRPTENDEQSASDLMDCKEEPVEEHVEDIEEEYIIDYEEVDSPNELHVLNEENEHELEQLEVEITAKAHSNGESGSEDGGFAGSVDHLSEEQRKMFLDAGGVKAHDWVCRGGRKIPIVECTFCNKTYRGRNTLRKHLKLHFKIKNYICGMCSQSFSDRSSLRLHELRHSAAKSFSCEHCDRSYYSQTELKQHCVLQHEERKFVCTVCSVKFPSKAILDDHSRVHLPDRPFVCNICGYSFKRNRNLARHMTCHKDGNPKGKVNGSILRKSVSCQYCSSLFEVPSELLEHLIDQHQPEYQRTRHGTHHCPYCYNSFDELDKCLTHQNQHYVFPVNTAGGRIYECGECGKQLRYKSLAQKHLLSHRTKRFFECPYKGCFKKYKHKIHYSRHVRGAHESTEQMNVGES